MGGDLIAGLKNVRIPKIKVPVRFVAVVIAIIGVGFLFWSMKTQTEPIQESTARLKSTNNELSALESELQKLYANMEYYISETTRLEDAADEVLLEFPTFMYLEDKILYVDTMAQGDLKEFNVSRITYGDSTFEQSVEYESADSNDNTVLEMYSVGLSLAFSDITYKQAKKMLDYGLTSDQRYVVTSMTLSYNEENGLLSGQMSFKTFFIQGQKTPYIYTPEVDEKLGTVTRGEDLFGTIEHTDAHGKYVYNYDTGEIEKYYDNGEEENEPEDLVTE